MFAGVLCCTTAMAQDNSAGRVPVTDVRVPDRSSEAPHIEADLNAYRTDHLLTARTGSNGRVKINLRPPQDTLWPPYTSGDDSLDFTALKRMPVELPEPVFIDEPLPKSDDTK